MAALSYGGPSPDKTVLYSCSSCHGLVQVWCYIVPCLAVRSDMVPLEHVTVTLGTDNLLLYSFLWVK